MRDVERDSFVNYLTTLIDENKSVMEYQAKHPEIVARLKKQNSAAKVIIDKLKSLEVNVL